MSNDAPDEFPDEDYGLDLLDITYYRFGDGHEVLITKALLAQLQQIQAVLWPCHVPQLLCIGAPLGWWEGKAPMLTQELQRVELELRVGYCADPHMLLGDTTTKVLRHLLHERILVCRPDSLVWEPREGLTRDDVRNLAMVLQRST